MKRIFKSFKFILILFLIFGWAFNYPLINFGGQGWPQIFNFPPKIQEAHAAVVYQGSSSVAAASTGADVTPDLPTHQAGDIFLLQVLVRDVDDTLTVTGWTQITTIDDGTAGRHWWYWKRAASASETAPLVDKNTTSGDTYATVTSYRGATTSGSPWEATSAAVCTGTADPFNLTGVTTLTGGSLVVASWNDRNNAVNSVTYSPTSPSALTSNMHLKSAVGNDGLNSSGSAVKADAGATGAVSVSPSKTPDGACGLVLALKPNVPPTISVSQPDGVSDTVTVGDSYNITYTLADTDDTVTAAFSYDTDNTGLNGTAITGACATAAEGSGVTCSWDTTGVTAGSYYVYGITNDGVNPQVSAYSPGQITIESAGALTVDIVDSGGTTVASPTMAMTGVTFSFDYQTGTGTFGVTDQKIRVQNTTANAQWTLNIEPSLGTTAYWDGALKDYDCNDPTASAGDGGDADSLGGQMTINASGATITPEAGCTNTGLGLGSSTALSEGVTNYANLITAGATAETDCYWDLTGVSISQTIPAEQPADTCTIDMTLTAAAV